MWRSSHEVVVTANLAPTQQCDRPSNRVACAAPIDETDGANATEQHPKEQERLDWTCRAKSKRHDHGALAHLHQVATAPDLPLGVRVSTADRAL